LIIRGRCPSLQLLLSLGLTSRHLRNPCVSREGGLGFSHDARQVPLLDFQFRRNERFLYEYDFGDWWQHEVRIERGLEEQPKRTYPVCVGGRRAAPPEDCGGPWAFLRQRDAVPFRVSEHLERLVAGVDTGDLEIVRDHLEAIESLREWLALDRFDRRQVNRRLRLYAAGDESWRWTS
jgi:Plasmid pRiA4b ORF-3-like protein